MNKNKELIICTKEYKCEQYKEQTKTLKVREAFKSLIQKKKNMRRETKNGTKGVIKIEKE